ncbi:MAG: hypothetical protein Q4Q28_05390 [Bacteroidales bacterium]|nr:hypothetical protein [Bacteroidales bacterium]
MAEVIWQDEPNQIIQFVNTNSLETNNFIKFVESDNEYVYFKLVYPETILPQSDTNHRSSTCNIVIGVRSVENYDYLWSWHLWLTKYSTQPVEVLPGTDAWALQTYNNVGHILRYGEAAGLPENLKMWSNRYKDKYVMDRNIGAGESSIRNVNQYLESIGMYYQWGRKDPFPQNGKIYNINGTELGELYDGTAISGGPFSLKMEQVPMTYAVQHPCTFFGYNEDSKPWMSSELNDNWNNPSWYEPGKGNGKSFYDPSPPGWQVPEPGIWDIFQKNQTWDQTKDANGNPTYFGEQDILHFPEEEGAFSIYVTAERSQGLITEGDILGFGFFRTFGSTDDCTADYAYWGLRHVNNGALSYGERQNSGVWTCRKEGDSSINCFFFQYLNRHYNGTHTIKQRGVALTQWGIQVRSIHQ